MAKVTLPLEGHCRCGQVRFRITAPPLATAACHCTGCQRMSSSAFSLTAIIPSEGFSVIQGEPVEGGLQGGGTHHYFCPHCMSWMFTRAEGMDDFVNIRPTMLEDPTALSTPFIETYASEKLPWAVTGAKHSYETFPPMEEFGPLIAEYATQS